MCPAEFRVLSFTTSQKAGRVLELSKGDFFQRTSLLYSFLAEKYENTLFVQKHFCFIFSNFH